MSDLKPCGCCGFTGWEMRFSETVFAYTSSPETGHKLRCEKCGTQTCWWHTKEECIEKWNTRTLAEGMVLVPVEDLVILVRSLLGDIQTNGPKHTVEDFGEMKEVGKKYDNVLENMLEAAEGIKSSRKVMTPHKTGKLSRAKIRAAVKKVKREREKGEA